MDWSTFNNAVQSWFATATGLTCIWANQGAPRPAFPYGVMNIIAHRNIAQKSVAYTYDEEADPGEDINVAINRHMVVTVSCEVLAKPSTQGQSLSHSTNAAYYISLAEDSLSKDSALSLLRASNIAYIDNEAPADLSGLVAGEMVSRCKMDVHFNAVSITTDTAISWINTVAISGDFDHSAVDFNDDEFGG